MKPVWRSESSRYQYAPLTADAPGKRAVEATILPDDIRAATLVPANR